MCKKQCRDANGFKCHMESESHLRQAELAASNPTKYIGEYSKEFEQRFLKLLQRRFGTRRVRANNVYQEYIADKGHLHMNATVWATLTDFVKYLGRQGFCEIDQDEQGIWYIQWIQRDRELLARQAAMDRKRKMEADDETRHNERMARLAAEAMAERGDVVEEVAPTALDWSQVDRVKIALPGKKAAPPSAAPAPRRDAEDGPDGEERGRASGDAPRRKRAREEGDGGSGRPSKKAARGVPTSAANVALEGLLSEIETEQQRKERRKREEEEAERAGGEKEKEKGREREKEEGWLARGIVVKVRNKKLAKGRYDGRKGTVTELETPTVAHVEIHDGGDLLRLPQRQLETVIPKPGRVALLLRGPYRGLVATVETLEVDRFCASLRLAEGADAGNLLEGVSYEDFSKLDRKKA